MALSRRSQTARLLSIGCAATVAISAPAQGSADASLQAAANIGYDTNATRDFLNTGAVPDYVASVQADAQGHAANARGAVNGAYAIGARAFASLGSEDTLVQSARAQAGAFATRWLELGLEGNGKDRRGGERNYTDGAAGVFANIRPSADVEGSLRVGAHRFRYWPAFQYSYSAPELGSSLQVRASRRQWLTFFADLEERTYNALANPAPSRGVRQDSAWTVGATYSYRGPFTLAVTYSYSSQHSNSFGESLMRHRVTAEAGFRLPWHLLLFAEGALQLVRYPDGIYLSPTIQLLEDNENTNSLSVRLVRPLSAHWDVELNYALYYSRLPTNSLTYLRQLATVGLGFQL